MAKILSLIFFLTSFEVYGAGAIKAKTWVLGSQSVVRLKDDKLVDQKTCKRFRLKVSKTIKFDLACGDWKTKLDLSLQSSSSQSVAKTKGHTTITKYAYMSRAAQVSQLRRSKLKIPYVEEIVHFYVNKKNELAFYYEKFRLDEFGRVVQDQRIQAYSLVAQKVELVTQIPSLRPGRLQNK